MIRPRILAAALCAALLSAACESSEPTGKEDFDTGGSAGVFCLCEGNMNAGNASLSYYDPATRKVQNEVFYRANGAKLGDVAQSISVHEGRVFIPMDNSGVIWALDADTFRVEGKIEAASSQHPDENNHIVAPRYVHFISDTKAYATDLFSPYITVFDPRTCKVTGAIPTGQAPSTGSYNSTEQMVQYGKWVFVNCWSYSNKILVIDSEQDKAVHQIELRSIQPNSLAVDRNGKLWALTDGGYAGSEYGQTEPCLYRIDAATWRVEEEFAFEKEESPSELCINGAGDTIYFINDGICKMSVTATHAPVKPLIPNERRHQIYGLAIDPASGEIYVGDAVDFEQPGVVCRYRDTAQGVELVDSFGVGMLPGAFAFK